MSRKITLIVLFLWAFCAGRAAAGFVSVTGQASTSITSVTVSCSPASITLKQTSACSATVKGGGSFSSKVTWAVSPSNAGAVSAAGLFTPASTLTAVTMATIKATSTQDTTESGSATVTVTPPTITSVSVACSPASISIKQTSACTATVIGTGSYNSAVTWGVSPSSGGSVSNAGVFTAASSISKATQVTVTATSTQDTSKSGWATVTVTPPTITSVSVSCTPATVIVTQTSTCAATVTGTGNYSSAVAWTVSPASSGTVSSAGVFTPTPSLNKAAKPTITATSTEDATKSGSATVNVAGPTITSVAVTCSPASITPAQTSKCTATVKGTGNFNAAVAWSVSPAGAGIVSSTGVYTPTSTLTGTSATTITATSGQDSTKSGIATVTVVGPAITSVAVACTPATVTVAQTSACAATVKGTGSFNTAVKWTVSPASAGTVSGTGVFTPKATLTVAATATITATSTQDATKSGSATVNVSGPAVTSVSVSCAPADITTKQTSACVATVAGTGNYASAVAWTVSPSVIGTVASNGVFTPNVVGTATVTATSTVNSAKSGSATVTVSTASHAGFPGDYFMVPPTPEYGATGFGAPVYDPQIKEVFFSNPSMNEVEAYSTEDGHRVGAVTVPGPMGLSLSPDNTLLAVGTSTPYVYFVDPLALHVTGQVEIPLSYFSFSDWGEEAPTPYLMASGPMLIAIGSTAGGELVSYNLATNTFARANPSAGGGFSDALPARSLDGKYLIVLTSDQQLALYSAAAQGYVSSGPGAYYRTLAANLDGTQFAAAFEGGKIAVLNQALQQQYQYTITNWPDTPSLVFSRDGKYLYIRENLDLAALNAQTGALAGYQGLSIASTDSGIVSDVDENYRAIGATSLGVFVSSVANLQPKVPPQLNFFTGMGGSTVGNPNEGALAGGTAVQTCSSEVGSLFGSSEEAYFGTIAATSDAISGACITATTPAASTAGPVTLLLTDANNNAVLVPNGYSYGPHVHWLSPDALSPKQPSTVWISTDGILPWNANVQTLTIGGKSDSVVVSNQTTADPTGFNAGVTPGSPGWGDLTLTLTDGSSETVKNAVQFLAQDVTVGTGNYTSAVYDALRDRFYLVGTNNKVAVFDPGTAKFLQPLQSSLVSSNAVLGSVAITPDDSKLVVSDVADRSVVVFDLASGTSVAANVLLPSETLSSAAPIPVITTNGNQAFVFPILMDMMSSVIREIDLSTMAVQTRSDIPPALGGFPPNSASSSGDGSVALFGWSFAGGTGGFQYLWKYDSAADTFSAPIQFPAAESFPLAVNADGSVLSAGINILGQDLEPVVPLWDSGAPYSSLTASGALLYRAGGAVEILDVRSGRSLLIFPVFTAGPADYASAFAIDPTGRKILACGANSLMYFELSAVPLAAVTVTPSAAAPGETVTVRGNGFVSGTSATIRGASAACTMQDDSTLQCEVPNVSPGTAPMFLTNPDGQEYLFEGAMVVQ